MRKKVIGSSVDEIGFIIYTVNINECGKHTLVTISYPVSETWCDNELTEISVAVCKDMREADDLRGKVEFCCRTKNDLDRFGFVSVARCGMSLL